MDIGNLLVSLSCGALAGWLAGILMKGSGLNLLGNTFVGIFGGVIGGYLSGLFDMSINGVIGSILMATAGAVVLIYLVEVMRKTREPAVRRYK